MLRRNESQSASIVFCASGRVVSAAIAGRVALVAVAPRRVRNPLLAESGAPPYASQFYGVNVSGPLRRNRASFTFDSLIRKTRDDLFSGLSLRAVTRAMRGSGIPTVSEQRAREEGRPGTGAEWTSIVVRTMLLNAAVVGQQVRNGQRVDAPWPEIITEDDQARLRIIFDDPARQTNGGNTPRWLLSGLGAALLR